MQQKFVWEVDNNLMIKCRKFQGQSFDSDILSNDKIWMLSCRPHGSNQINKDDFEFDLQLMYLPPNILAIKVKCSLK